MSSRQEAQIQAALSILVRLTRDFDITLLPLSGWPWIQPQTPGPVGEDGIPGVIGQVIPAPEKLNPPLPDRITIEDDRLPYKVTRTDYPPKLR